MTTMKAYSWPRLLPLLGALALAFLLLGLLSLSVTGLPAARAAGTVRYVAATGNDTGNDCANSAAPCATVQHAVDVAAAGDEIRVAAGTYTGVWGRPKPVGYPGPDVITQSVYVSKTVIVRGGYTTANWTTSDPAANQTALDAEGQGRVMVIANNISPTVEGLRITGGNATGLRGWRYSSAGAGGGIYVRSASPIISNCAIYSNTGDILTDGYGGGLYLLDSTAVLIANRILTNTATTHWLGYGYGGGLYLDHSNAVLMGNYIQGNGASVFKVGYGGGLYISGSAVTLTENYIVSNTASLSNDIYGYGGGMYIANSSGTLDTNTVQDNLASSYGGNGGGLYLAASPITLTGNAIVANKACYVGICRGGGLSLHDSNATLLANKIMSNTAAVLGRGEGGGLYLYGQKPTLTRNFIQGNLSGVVGSGGGLYLFESGAILSENTIMNNTAGTTFFQGGEGGGVTLWGSAATLTRNRIIHNTASITATGWGGGLFLVGGPVILMENTIVSNTASGADFGRGGGIAAMGYGSHRLINNIIAANWVGPIGQGDGYYAAGNLGGIRASFFHNTFADNAKDAIVTGGGCTTLSLSNTLISGHSLGISTTASHYCNKIVADHTLWNSAYTIAEAGNTITTTNDITGNPHFVNPAALDYHISPASEAIDQGMNARVTTDIDGQRRPYGTGFDIGADEFVPEPLLRRWFPMLLKK